MIIYVPYRADVLNRTVPKKRWQSQVVDGVGCWIRGTKQMKVEMRSHATVLSLQPAVWPIRKSSMTEEPGQPVSKKFTRAISLPEKNCHWGEESEIGSESLMSCCAQASAGFCISVVRRDAYLHHRVPNKSMVSLAAPVARSAWFGTVLEKRLQRSANAGMKVAVSFPIMSSVMSSGPVNFTKASLVLSAVNLSCCKDLRKESWKTLDGINMGKLHQPKLGNK